MNVETADEVPPLAEKLLVGAKRRRRISFLQGWGPWETTHAPVDGYTFIQIQAVLSGLKYFCLFFLKSHEVVKEKKSDGGEIREQVVGGFDQIILHAWMKFSNNKNEIWEHHKQ